MPESLEQLDLLLMHEVRARRIRRDGIHFQELRYLSLTLAVYVGEVHHHHQPAESRVQLAIDTVLYTTKVVNTPARVQSEIRSTRESQAARPAIDLRSILPTLKPLNISKRSRKPFLIQRL